MKYVSLDLETTGLDTEQDSVLEIGAVFVDTKEKVIKEFSKILYYDRVEGSPFALSLNKRLLDKISALDRCEITLYGEVILPEDLDIMFTSFLNDCGYTRKDSVLFAGKNFKGFDEKFLKKVTKVYSHHRCLDPAMLFLDITTDMFPPSLELCKKRACFESGLVSHTALEDAKDVVDLITTYYTLDLPLLNNKIKQHE